MRFGGVGQGQRRSLCPPRIGRRQLSEFREIHAEHGEHQVLRDYIQFSFLQAHDAGTDVIDQHADIISVGYFIQPAHIP